MTSKGYTPPSDDVVDPVYRGKPDDNDIELVNLTRNYEYTVTYNHRIVTATAEKSW